LNNIQDPVWWVKFLLFLVCIRNRCSSASQRSQANGFVFSI